MGVVHLDAGVVIGFLDADDAHHAAARRVLSDALDAGERIEMAASSFAECLVGPARRGAEAVAVVRSLVERVPIVIVPLDESIAVTAAMLSATHPKLRPPDALVVATAMERSAGQLVTTDRGWPTARALELGARIVTIWPPEAAVTDGGGRYWVFAAISSPRNGILGIRTGDVQAVSVTVDVPPDEWVPPEMSPRCERLLSRWRIVDAISTPVGVDPTGEDVDVVVDL